MSKENYTAVSEHNNSNNDNNITIECQIIRGENTQ